MSQENIQKKCVDSLRTFTQENFNIKIKASHAHELVAAYFGYNSKNALIADKKYSLSRISEAAVFVMVPDEFVDNRISDFKDFSLNMADVYSLGEAIYTPLFADISVYKSEYPPFKNFDLFAKYYLENNQRWNDHFQKLGKFKLDHIVDVKQYDELVEIVVIHTSKKSDVDYVGIGKTTLTLPRVVGKIGFLKPEMKLESWSGQARKHFKLNKRV